MNQPLKATSVLVILAATACAGSPQRAAAPESQLLDANMPSEHAVSLASAEPSGPYPTKSMPRQRSIRIGPSGGGAVVPRDVYRSSY